MVPGAAKILLNTSNENDIEETNEQFYEFDLHLNNHEQFNEEGAVSEEEVEE
jgi:hypothetical protein